MAKTNSAPGSGPVARGLQIHELSFLENGPYSLNLAAGECCGLSGESGIGKSQFLRAIADVAVHDGECLLHGVPCSSFTPQNWRKSVALVPAESFWWHDSVGPHFTAESVENAPSLPHLLGRLGFGTDVLNWQISRLSTGERQRLSLVRTLLTRPQVLLLDEPTSGLDKQMAAVVEEIVTEICDKEQSCCLWVSHDLEQLGRIADHSFHLERKKLSEILL